MILEMDRGGVGFSHMVNDNHVRIVNTLIFLRIRTG